MKNIPDPGLEPGISALGVPRVTIALAGLISADKICYIINNSNNTPPVIKSMY